MVTHDPDVAAQCERIVHIRDGVIVADEQLAASVAALAGGRRRTGGAGRCAANRLT